MKTTTPFANFIDVLKNMPPAEKSRIIKNHQEFHRLRTWCSAKGDIEVLPKMTGIRVIKKTKEVAELKKLMDELKPKGIKWTEDGVDKADKKG